MAFNVQLHTFQVKLINFVLAFRSTSKNLLNLRNVELWRHMA